MRPQLRTYGQQYMTSHNIDQLARTGTELIIRVPWELNSIGKRTVVKAELVDLYRTLAELSGLSSSAPEIEASVQGTSLAAAFKGPAYPMTKPAFSQIGRCSCGQFCPGGPVNAVSQNYCPCANNGTACGGPRREALDWIVSPSLANRPGKVMECGANACCKVPLDGGGYDYIGYSMRTDNRRFTAWVTFNATTLSVDWSKVAATELYDLTEDDGRDFDFDGYSTNIASRFDENEVASLLKQLQQHVDLWY